MVAVDAWQQQGFGEIAKSYLTRLVPQPGVRREIDDNGDLLVHRLGRGEVERCALVPALAQSAWFDAASGGPRK